MSTPDLHGDHSLPVPPSETGPRPVTGPLVDLATDPHPPAFAVLRRSDGPGVEVLVGDVVEVESLADIPLPETPSSPPVLALVPFRQVVERGYVCHDDGTPLLCLIVRSRTVLTPQEALDQLPQDPVRLRDLAFDVDDNAYAAIVKQVIGEEIGRGEGANFVIRRDLCARLDGPPAPRAALALMRRLLLGEPGAYWTFAIHTPDVTMVGATPERHVSVTGGEVVMNPISGTYRYPGEGPTREDLLSFLHDPKEIEELYMVVDEELKMMSQVCDRGGRVSGPYLKQMSQLAHTEYLLTGNSSTDVREILRETMFAATVTGSPVENACAVITRYESGGRGYYAGMAALLERDGAGDITMDAPILIRTVYLTADGEARLPVGATLVRHSIPEHEVAETHAKAAGVLAAFGSTSRGAVHREMTIDGDVPGDTSTGSAAGGAPDGPEGTGAGSHPRLGDLEGVARALARRNDVLAPFWMHPQLDRPQADLVGLPVEMLPRPYQGTQRRVHVFGRDARVGFYNTFAARVPAGRTCHRATVDLRTLAGTEPVAPRGPSPDAGFEVWADQRTGEVFALRSARFASTQFHLESVLSLHGMELLRDLLSGLVGTEATASRAEVGSPGRS